MATAPDFNFPEPNPVTAYTWVKSALALVPLKNRKDRETVHLVADALKTLPYDCDELFFDWTASVGFTRYAGERVWKNAKANQHAWDDLLQLFKDIEARRTRFQFDNAAQVEATPAIDWRVKLLFPERGTVAIFGQSGSGKTFIASHMAMAIAAGVPFFGHAAKPGQVVYLALEGQAGFPTRLKAWRLHHGIPIPDNIRFSPGPFNLLDPQDVADLAALCPPGCTVFLDTAFLASPGLDENNAKDMSRFIAGVQTLQRLIAGLVVFVAHTGKDEAKGLRGHSSLIAALDAAIMVRRGEAGARTWKLAKAKDGKDGEEHGFRLQIVELGSDADGDPVTSCVIVPDDGATSGLTKPLTANQKLGIATLQNVARSHGMLGGDGRFLGVQLSAWREEFYRKHTGEDGAKKKAFQRARAELAELGHIEVENDVYRFAGPNEGANTIIAAILAAKSGEGTWGHGGTLG